MFCIPQPVMSANALSRIAWLLSIVCSARRVATGNDENADRVITMMKLLSLDNLEGMTASL